MSSTLLENGAHSPRSPGERILMALKMQGAQTASALGKRLGTTGEAVRQQLVRLAEEGLVTTSAAPSGVGRPTQYWDLTTAAQARFPDTHAALTVQLLGIIRGSLGEAALDSIITRREDDTRATYEAAMSGLGSLHERVATLAALRSAEGYMAEWLEMTDGSLILIENHCPICAAAMSCQGFCRAELQVFTSVLGPTAHVERREHIVQGGRRCTYHIRQVDV
ncbi:helix-turn-helix transcriptional regulator [Ancylobacter polymorphus]|uniref:Transcriptional regulator n=1 Tax=Ancylobacter polymorphus TaxID=223390 RepID=A0A9E7CYB5_9HYPH|nr:metalloregulator ArsR/SmtB family transcription factor [Ancylobacter polymorphus]UOK73344.1 transcriptional regulator [Ancylobacter polymorphus]